jgi:hypothetical protein
MKTLAKMIIPLFIISCGILVSHGLPDGVALAVDQPGMSMGGSTEADGRIINRASNIIAREVINHKREHLGYSKDLIIGENGCILYLVLQRGSAFGVIGPLIPVPWSMVILQEFNKPILVKVKEDVILNAPGFTPNKWPAYFSPEKMKDIDMYYREHLGK